MVDNLSSSSLALTDIAEGGMAFVTRDEENHVIQQYGLCFPKIRRFADELGHVCDVAMEHGYGLVGFGD